MKKKLCVVFLTAMMALSLSGCGSSSKYSEMAAADMAMPEEAPAPEFEVTEEAAIEESPAENGMTDAGAGEANAQVTQTTEKIIYTYNYSVETKQFDTFMQAVLNRISEYGGYLENSETNGNAEMNISRYANLVIRIPAERMHDFLNMVEENSNVTYSRSSTENVTLNYVDMQSHIKALKTEQETLMGILERATKLEDIITIQNQLTNIRYELESYESQLRVFDNRINYSTLYLDINEVERETNVATEMSYGEEIAQGLSDTFYDLGQGLRSFSIWFVVNLPYILLWIVIIVVLVFIARAVFRRMYGEEKREKKKHGRKNKSGVSGTEEPKNDQEHDA